MARKRKQLKDLEYDSQEYWDKLLKSEGLAADRARPTWLTYVGDASSLEYIEGRNKSATGRIPPFKPAD